MKKGAYPDLGIQIGSLEKKQQTDRKAPPKQPVLTV
jgi:hypothetical protein